jgi:signal transduction histidine kinase
MIAGSRREDAFPAETEERLAAFTELVATAIANAHARDELRAVAEEQAALRRVATLVAAGVPPDDVFAAVAAEVGQLLPAAAFASVGRYAADGTVAFAGTWSPSGGPAEFGTLRLGGHNAATLVYEQERPVRIDRYSDASEVAEAARAAGLRSSVGAPISVAGTLWGVMIVNSAGEEAFAAGTEMRMAEFTELLGTAIANAEAQGELTTSRAQIEVLAEERTQLLADALEAEQRERRSLAEALHDHALQNLLSARQDLDEALEATAHPALDRARTALVRTTGELRDAVFELHPYVLEEAGLQAAVRSLAEDAAGRAGLDLDLDLRYEGRHPREPLLFSAARELISNVVRHSGASRLTVRLVDDTGGVELAVEDDGHSFALDRLSEGLAEGHVGLASQRVRIEAAGGSIRIEAAPGSGTRVAVWVPG